MSAAAGEQQPEIHINNLPTGILHNVFELLGPADLARSCAVCHLWRKLNRDEAANRSWKRFYASRWRVNAGQDVGGVCWQSRYSSKRAESAKFAGKFVQDNLYGHKAGVKSLRLLPSHSALATGSLDRTVRLWDLASGMPLSTSRPHGGTVRAVAIDAHTLVSGSTDNVLRVWAPSANHDDPDACGNDGDDDDLASEGALAAAAAELGLTLAPRHPSPLFDLAAAPQQLRGHIGPISTLCLTPSALYSGSWDYSVRVWRRSDWHCASVLKYEDWVWGVVARGPHLLVSSGSEVHVHDLASGKTVRKFQHLHEAHVSCLEGAHSGRLLFTGGPDGLVLGHDLRMRQASGIMWHHNAGVNALALETPWLASCASDGSVVMVNIESGTATRSGGPGSSATSANAANSSSSCLFSAAYRRSLPPPPGGGPMYAVDICDSWLAAGGEADAVRTWDFSRAPDAAMRAATARMARGSRRARRRNSGAAAAAAHAAAAAAAGAGLAEAGELSAAAACAGLSTMCPGPAQRSTPQSVPSPAGRAQRRSDCSEGGGGSLPPPQAAYSFPGAWRGAPQPSSSSSSACPAASSSGGCQCGGASRHPCMPRPLVAGRRGSSPRSCSCCGSPVPMAISPPAAPPGRRDNPGPRMATWQLPRARVSAMPPAGASAPLQLTAEPASAPRPPSGLSP